MKITFEEKLSDGAWFVGPEKIMVNPKELDSDTLKQYITEIYAKEYWEWGQIPNVWNWVAVAPKSISLDYELDLGANGIQLYVDGRESRILYPNDEFILLSERIRILVKFEDNLWKIYHNDELYGYYEYVTG